MILSSDKLSGLGKPIVQLKLDTASTTEGVIREQVIEMDIKELNLLLKSLKGAQLVSLLFCTHLIVFLYHRSVIITVTLFLSQAAQAK